MLKVAGGGGGTAGLTYKGTWDASTNSPTLTSSVGTNGDYYVVSTAGNTDLDGIKDGQIGDWAIFNGTVWQKIDQSNTVTSVNGETGAVVLGVANIAGAVPNTVNVIADGLLTGGGALTGNVTVSLTSVPVANVTGAVPNTVNILADGLLTGGGALTGNVTISLNSVPVANVTGAVPNTVNVIAGVGLDGGGALTGNVTIDLGNTAVVAGSYGNSGAVASFTVDDQGRLTAASNVTIVATEVNLGNTSANATFVTSELPLVPEGYIVVQVAGVNKKIPYYGV